MYGNGMMGGIGWVFMLLFWGLAIAGVVYLVKHHSDKGGREANGVEQTPLDILKRRYVSGDIDEQEYQRMKKNLE